MLVGTTRMIKSIGWIAKFTNALICRRWVEFVKFAVWHVIWFADFSQQFLSIVKIRWDSFVDTWSPEKGWNVINAKGIVLLLKFFQDRHLKALESVRKGDRSEWCLFSDVMCKWPRFTNEVHDCIWCEARYSKIEFQVFGQCSIHFVLCGFWYFFGEPDGAAIRVHREHKNLK